MKPLSIFDVINQNVVTVGEDLHALMSKVEHMHKDIDDLKCMLTAPEEPIASGEEGEEEVK